MLLNYTIVLNEDVIINHDTLTGIGKFTVYDKIDGSQYCDLIADLQCIRSIYVKYNDNDLIIKPFSLSTQYIFDKDDYEFKLFLNSSLLSLKNIKCTNVTITKKYKVDSFLKKRTCNIL